MKDPVREAMVEGKRKAAERKLTLDDFAYFAELVAYEVECAQESLIRNGLRNEPDPEAMLKAHVLRAIHSRVEFQKANAADFGAFLKELGLPEWLKARGLV